MLTEQELSAAIGSTAYGADGDRIGTVEHFFVDDRTGVPSWVAVTTGLFGTRHSVVPALDATFADGALWVPVTRDAAKSAPEVGGARLEPAEEVALRRHYGLDAPAPTWTPTAGGVAPVAAVTDAAPPPPAAPVVPAGPPAASAAAAATEHVAATRPRLVTYVVTEEVQVTVPIRREEVRVEHVPVDAPDDGPGESLMADDRSGAGSAAPSGLPGEIVLHTERPVITVEVVPAERVRLRTDLAPGEEGGGDQVQRERIALDQTPTISPS